MRRFIIILVVLAVIIGTPIFGSGRQEGAAPDAPGATVLRYLHFETRPGIYDAINNAMQDFMAQNPDIFIDAEATSAQMVNHKIAAYLRAGVALDVIQSDLGTGGRMASTGLLEPLDDVVEALGGRDAFLPGSLLMYDDVVYGINLGSSTLILYYRTDLFAEAGLEPPTNWDELLHAARTLHSPPNIAGISLPADSSRATPQFAGQFLWQAGGDFFDRDLNVTLDTPEARKAVEFYAQLLQYAPEDVASYSYADTVFTFTGGRSAMTVYWQAMDFIYDQNPDLLDKVGAVILPKGEMHASYIGAKYTVIHADSQNKEAAKGWIKHLYRADVLANIGSAMIGMYFPVTYAGADALRAMDHPRTNAIGQFYFDVMPRAMEHAFNAMLNAGGINKEQGVIEETGVFNPYVDVLHNTPYFAEAIQRVAFEGWTPERAVREAQTQLERAVAEARREREQ